MSNAVTTTPPVATDIAVVLTGIIRAEPDVGGYSASIPALPGCHTQGETLEEVRANLREAAEDGLPSLMMTVSPAKQPKEPREDYFR